MIQGLAGHLLQSTIFAAVAGMFTLFLRNNHARTRFWIWFIASMKFLAPFSLFVAIGHRLSWSAAPAIAPVRMVFVMDEISQPFVTPEVYAGGPVHPVASASSIVPSLLLAIWICGCAAVLIFWFVRWRRVAGILRSAAPMTNGRELCSLRGLERIAGVSRRTELLSSATQMEPGVFGILRPVLSFPAGITEYLNDEQLDAILAHELCHVRRHDNLTAALHMLVEAVFWFHPMVWWIGARLVEERERACDEEVVRLGSDPELYAETVLQVCKLYLASPLACAAGISGSNLARRIESIMENPFLKSLSFGKKVLLTATGLVALMIPIAAGMLSARSGQAQNPPAAPAPVPPPATTEAVPVRAATSTAPRPEFSSVTVQPETPGVEVAMAVGGPGTMYPDQIVYSGTTLRWLISRAYAGQVDAISGPEWLNSEKYYIVAKVPPGADPTQPNLMLRNLLETRFHLAVHRERKNFSGYALVVLGDGSSPRFQLVQSARWPTTHEAIAPPAITVPAPRSGFGSAPVAYGAAWLPPGAGGGDRYDPDRLSSYVIDRTGQPGFYDSFLGFFGGMPAASGSGLTSLAVLA